MRSVEIQLVEPDKLLRSLLLPKVILLLVFTVAAIFFLFTEIFPDWQQDLMLLIWIVPVIILCILSVVVSAFFEQKRAKKLIEEITHVFDENGLLGIQTVQMSVPIVKINGIHYPLADDIKLPVSWTSKFTLLWRSRRFSYLTARSSVRATVCSITLPRRILIANADEVIAFLESLPNVPPVIFKALE